ncbi:hypothetical protein [Pelagerythrobacter aerophilus]|nr:hypothetical protein [Pelagerythrobacter aerophilus]
MTMQTSRAASPGDDRRAQAEALLARYPDLSQSEIDDLRRWFGKEATALETAMLAGDEHLGGPYQQFRKDHLDRLSALEKGIAGAVGALLIGGLAALAIML